MDEPGSDVEFTPIAAPSGRLVHATSLRSPGETVCGKKFRGWVISLRRVTCNDCKLAIGHKCRRRRSK